MNCNLANACSEVLPLISKELEGIFPAKFKGLRVVDNLGVDFQLFSDRCTMDPESLLWILNKQRHKELVLDSLRAQKFSHHELVT